MRKRKFSVIGVVMLLMTSLVVLSCGSDDEIDTGENIRMLYGTTQGAKVPDPFAPFALRSANQQQTNFCKCFYGGHECQRSRVSLTISGAEIHHIRY